jgi:comEA protein
MSTAGKFAKSEKFLLLATLVFIVALAAAFWHDHSGVERDSYTVTTQEQADPEEVVPPLELVNINTATAAELDELPGIGAVLAERIVAYREEHGSFQSKEELMEVSGIGEGKYSELMDLITVEEAQT